MLASLFALASTIAIHMYAAHALPPGGPVTPIAATNDASPLLDITSHAARDEVNITQRAQSLNLLLCSQAPCGSGVCKTFDLLDAQYDTCYDAGMTFESADIQDVGFVTAPFRVLVGLPGCGEFAQIPYMNECYEPTFSGAVFAIAPNQ